MKKRAKKQKGQIAIFLLMVFQLLFILFAMTVNVALTVHDKINLQNSVDLAAIYGAKKQAEVLNAIAHINFQMRQNYKLLAWRFRILSTAVTPRFEGDGHCTQRHNPNIWCPQNRECLLAGSCENRYVACFSADRWTRGIKPDSQNMCLNKGFDIRAPEPLEVIFPNPMNYEARDKQLDLRTELTQSCNAESLINWLMTQVFLSHFRLDQKDRKMMIHAIYNKTLKQGQDLEGNPIEEGVEKTFKKNLTLINEQSSKNFKVFNSLEGQDIKNFLEPQIVRPVLEYLYLGKGPGSEENACGNEQLKFSHENVYPSEFILNDPTDIAYKYKPYIDHWNHLFALNQGTLPASHEQFINPLTLSYSKKPDITVYYGVSATLTQSTFPQLFSPSSSLELKASAFAKPFGGRIGPTADKDLLALQIKPNYSRYPGDPYGLTHIDAHRAYYLIKEDLRRGRDFFKVNNYANLASGDALATDASGPYFVLRLMEMMAISPNIFDLLNYSISNNYMDTYFKKICKLIGPGGGCASGTKEITAPVQGATVPGYIRGDFGHPHTEDYTIKNQTVRVSSFVPFFFFPPNRDLFYNQTSAPDDIFGRGGPHGYSTRPPYLVKDPSHFLSGFVPTTSRDRYNDYSTPDPENFMKCYKPTQDPYHIPSGCAVGGRSGYSVKLISCETVDTQPGPEPTNINPDYCQ